MCNKESEYDQNDESYIKIFVEEISKLIDKEITENKLRESESLLSNLINNIPGFVYKCKYDENYTAIYLSDYFEKMTNFQKSDFIGNRN